MGGKFEPITVLPGGPVEVYRLGAGVSGYAIQVGDEIFIPLIQAVCEGSGAVGRWIDTLSPRCIFVNLTSARLRGMLERRGYKCEMRDDEEFGPVDHWSRK